MILLSPFGVPDDPVAPVISIAVHRKAIMLFVIIG
jgi:hypothetical protein